MPGIGRGFALLPAARWIMDGQKSDPQTILHVADGVFGMWHKFGLKDDGRGLQHLARRHKMRSSEWHMLKRSSDCYWRRQSIRWLVSRAVDSQRRLRISSCPFDFKPDAFESGRNRWSRGGNCKSFGWECDGESALGADAGQLFRWSRCGDDYWTTGFRHQPTKRVG